MDNLNRDVIFCIAQWLTLVTLLRFEQTCKRINKICKNPIFYKFYLKQLMINRDNACKNDIIEFLNGKMPLYSSDNLCNYRKIHVLVAKTIGIDKFMTIPILNLADRQGHTGYIDFVRNKEMTSPLMKGIDCYSRPFLAIKYVDRKCDEVRTLVIFHRYTNEEAMAVGTCYAAPCFNHARLWGDDINYLERLLLHKPCGSSCDDDDIRTLPNGQSIIELIE